MYQFEKLIEWIERWRKYEYQRGMILYNLY